jgi:hypothetical protein
MAIVDLSFWNAAIRRFMAGSQDPHFRSPTRGQYHPKGFDDEVRVSLFMQHWVVGHHR